jgi:hypothetical protein
MSALLENGPGRALNVGLGTSRRHLAQRAALLCLLVRHSTSLVVAMLSLIDADLTADRAGRVLLLALGVWSSYRLATRSLLWQFTAADYCWIVAVGLSAGLIVDARAFFETNNATAAVVIVAVSTFVLQVHPLLAGPMALTIAASYAWGSARVVGWTNIGHVSDLYYLIAGWVAAAAIRAMILRIADAVDRARGERQAAEIARSVSSARRDYDREQLALLHDTAAATLLMVGQEAEVSEERLAAQARRDLEALEHPPWNSPAMRIDIVDALRSETAHLRTPVRFTGLDVMWLRGDLAGAIVSAAREVTNNADRHANANLISIDVHGNRVAITDDGVGFTPGVGLVGHGIRASIVARMNRVGGAGAVHSAPAQGTVAELSWPDPLPVASSIDRVTDADRLIGRVRRTYSLAMTVYAIASLVAAVPPVVVYFSHAVAQAGLAAITGLCALSAIPAVLWGKRAPAWIAAFTLAVIAFVQPALLTREELTQDANWGQAAVGFCLLPLLLRWPTPRAAATLCAYWVGPAIIAVIRDPSEQMLIFLGLSVAGTVIPQVFATMFSSWASAAAQDARIEHDNLVQVLTAEQVAGAIQADYVKRYADVMTGVMPLLRDLAGGVVPTPEVRRQARAESRRLRTLFDQLRNDHLLVFEMRAVFEAAEDRGVEVTVHFDGDLPHLEQPDVDKIVDAVARLIAIATVSVRVVVSAADREITVSVVCEVAPEDEGLELELDGVDLTWSDRTAWMTIRHRIATMTDHPPDCRRA